MLNSRQEIVLHPDEQAAFLPGILQIQRLEVISQTPLSVPNNSHQTEVSQFLIFVQRPLLAFEDDGHVELLDDEVHHLSGGGVICHRNFDTCALSKTCVICSIDLEYVRFRTGPLSGVELVHDLVVVAVDAVHAGVVAPVWSGDSRSPCSSH